MSDYFEYISKGDQNLYVSLLNIEDCNRFFLSLDTQWSELCGHISRLPEISTKDAYFLTTTLFLVAQRQIRNAYYLLLRRMSYDALLPFRVALESIVFGYRIAKDPTLAEVWAKRNENRPEFNSRIRFADYPPDMPYRDEIKKEIDLLNEHWMHPNLNYAAQTVLISEKEIRVHSYDHDDQKYCLALFSILENSLRAFGVVRDSMRGKFSIYLTSTESEFLNLRTQLDNLKLRYQDKVK